MGNMDLLGDWTVEADQVLVFEGSPGEATTLPCFDVLCWGPAHAEAVTVHEWGGVVRAYARYF